MEKLNNRQKMAEMKARIIDEWIALSATAYDISELENHLFEIADEYVEDCKISFRLDNPEYIKSLFNGDSIIKLSCFKWITDVYVDGFFDYIDSEYIVNVIFTIDFSLAK
ncbi:hypothetical protein [Methanobrevibacter sp.]|uniref:hypothetical protein n=1 Tax=Methanobrevibacter sp. TaxID=66852 RepID=UPI003D7C8D1A